MNWASYLDALFKWMIGIFDPSFLAVVVIFLAVAWFLYCQDRRDDIEFKVVNFFKTNGYEDMAKLVHLLVTLILMWVLALQVKDKTLDLYMLCAYMAYGLGAPMFYALLKVITSIFGRPEIVNATKQLPGNNEKAQQ